MVIALFKLVGALSLMMHEKKSTFMTSLSGKVPIKVLIDSDSNSSSKDNPKDEKKNAAKKEDDNKNRSKREIGDGDGVDSQDDAAGPVADPLTDYDAMLDQLNDIVAKFNNL